MSQSATPTQSEFVAEEFETSVTKETTTQLAQGIAVLVESTEYQIENAADRAAAILNLETCQAASSAWQQWCTEYAGKIVEVSKGGHHTLRIDTILSRLKSTPQPCIQDVLQEAIDAWRRDGRDSLELLNATVKWRTGSETWEMGVVKPILR